MLFMANLAEKKGLKHCIKCGKVICEKRAIFYKSPLSDMCNEHRQIELDKIMAGDGTIEDYYKEHQK